MSFGQNFKGLLKNGASRKLLLFSGGVITLAVGYAMFAPTPESAPPSQVAGGPGSGAFGGNGTAQNNPNPAYLEELKKDDQNRIESAKKSGGSAMPTVLGLGKSEVSTDLSIEEKEEEEPKLPTLPKVPAKLEKPELPKVAPEKSVQLPQPKAPSNKPSKFERQMNEAEQLAHNERVQRMRQVMDRLVSSQVTTYAPGSTMYVYNPKKDEEQAGSAGSGGSGQSPAEVLTVSGPGSSGYAANGAGQQGADALPVDVPLAGEIIYAQMIGEANSDAPGPVLARILQGPLAGATVIGSFSVTRDALVIRFDRMTIRETVDGKKINDTIPIQAVAVDAKHIGTAMATSVDHHYPFKIANAFLTAGARGMSELIRSSGSTTVIQSDGSTTTSNPALSKKEKLAAAAAEGVAATGEVIGSVLGNRPTTVKVEAETPFGLMFL